MYKKQLTEDLGKIFEFDRVLFGVAEYGEEQDALYVRVDESRSSFASGKAFFILNGVLSTISDGENANNGYFNERYSLSSEDNKKRLLLEKVESNIPFSSYERFFVKYSVRFRYTLEMEWNPPPAKMTAGKITVESK